MDMHDGWTHDQELAWAKQEHEQTIAQTLAEEKITASREQHDFDLKRLEAGEDVAAKKRRQVWRFRIAVGIVGVWLLQVLYSTYHALRNPALLIDIEKIVLLVGITGTLVAVLVNKVWPDNDDKPRSD